MLSSKRDKSPNYPPPRGGVPFDVAKVEEVVMKALTKDALQGVESVQAFADALTRAQSRFA